MNGPFVLFLATSWPMTNSGVGIAGSSVAGSTKGTWGVNWATELLELSYVISVAAHPQASGAYSIYSATNSIPARVEVPSLVWNSSFTLPRAEMPENVFTCTTSLPTSAKMS